MSGNTTKDISFLCDTNDIIKKVIESTIPIRPVTVLVYGTSGSGKSQILHDVLKKYDLDKLTLNWKYLVDNKIKPDKFDVDSIDRISCSESSFSFPPPSSPSHPVQLCSNHKSSYYRDYNLVPILHDEILTNIPSYRDSLPNFIEKLQTVSATHDLSIYDQIATEFDNLYQDYKKYVYLVTSHLIDCCIANKRNILIETTGNNLDYIEETIKKIKGNGYYVVCLYPFIKIETIFQRIIARAKTCGRIIHRKFIIECYRNSLSNFIKLSTRCDECYMIDTEMSFTSHPSRIIYHKRYENYKKVNEIVNGVGEVFDYMMVGGYYLANKLPIYWVNILKGERGGQRVPLNPLCSR